MLRDGKKKTKPPNTQEEGEGREEGEGKGEKA